VAVLKSPRFAQLLCRGSFLDGRPTPWLFVVVIEVALNFFVAAFQKPMGKFAFADLLVLVSFPAVTTTASPQPPLPRA